MALTWTCLHHSALDKAQLHCLLKLRCEVFVVEQQCAYPDIDGLDLAGDTHHLLGEQGEQLLAYLRLLPRDTGEVAIGRVIIAPAARGQGLGHQLMAQALEQAALRWPGQGLYLSAQAHLTDYYKGYGFSPEGEPYLEDGIPHIDMRKPA
ncbi:MULTISPECIES: GNAT family N-acetyltransferase [unclassified Pseudomonas]|uniref:GNAT family N-acetyltransferase n=1 Tax=unclassified Pseudomonas TaxID=196821 RepID=UPI000BCDDC1E|nr:MULTISPECIES: GNAT family N-acetyltransferase [unclassified Pseudomonas]PVZ20382.1 ElaA protein [Pseudomonas sp. URIL14HWK12:I12]PVZ27448.1 ElaA protein [Pseudomonas sp. URIL14HWK12:I10]PVZ38337.1 ElaA protein [Pseudomonas sp. URIL14HWK12:I11]SNZ03762.1 ElaA protein [Pseudomonas sp. URIL14HWK12:I9]